MCGFEQGRFIHGPCNNEHNKKRKLGKGVWKFIPSCVVVAIRHEFPEADNTYTGFKIYHELSDL